MTDRERPEAVAEAFRAGADDYIPRLAPAELLFSRVDTLVALKHSVQEALETRRRIAELEKLKTLGVLSAGLAHEINTPNNAVLRNIPLLADIWHEFLPVIRSYRDEKGEFDIRGFTSKDLFVEVPELLSDIYTAGSQIKKIVEDLKDYSRSSPSGILRDVDMRRVVAYASRLLGPQIEKTTRAYFTEYSENIPLVRADFPKLTQVAINIIENALQSLTDPEQAVRVKLYLEETERGDRVVFECSDEGIGIPDEVLGRVFEPFFTTKRESGGTGLGLSVSLGIVRECGGDIEISSKKEGGALVRVLLPLDMDAAAAIDGGKSGRSLE